MHNFRKEQWANPKKTSGQKDKRTEGQKERRTDGQTLIHGTLATTARNPIKPLKNYAFSIMQYATDSVIQELSIYYFRFSTSFSHQHNPTIWSPNLVKIILICLFCFNFPIRKEVKLSVTDVFFPLNFLLFMKDFS